MDAGLVALAYFLAYQLRFDREVPALYQDLFERTIRFVVLGSVFVFSLFGLYRHWMRYSSQREYMQVGQAVIVATLALLAYVAAVQPKLHVHRRPVHLDHDPGRRARASRAADALLPRRLALPRAPAV